jgi:hypothetical protein
MKLNHSARYKTAGDGLIFLIIFLGLIGGGIWWLYAHKNAMDKEGRLFGKQMIEAVAVHYDINFFRNNLGPQAKVEYAPSRQQEIINQFQQLGVPLQPISIEENMTWENQFFEPHGFFTAHLKYPARGATMRIAISHPVGKWQLDNIELAADRQL